MERQFRCHATARIYIFKIFVCSFFSSPTTCCLRLTMSAPLVWPGLSMVLMLKVSGSLALWTWLSVLALCCCCLSVCLQVPVLLSGSTLVLESESGSLALLVG